MDAKLFIKGECVFTSSHPYYVRLTSIVEIYPESDSTCSISYEAGNKLRFLDLQINAEELIKLIQHSQLGSDQ